MSRKALFSAAVLLGVAAAAYAVVADAWAHHLGRKHFVAGEQDVSEEHHAKLRLASRLAPWDGVLKKRASDLAFAFGENRPRERFEWWQEAERGYVRAWRQAPGHYLTAWALGDMAFRAAPEVIAPWHQGYGAAVALFPVHSVLRKEFAIRLCEASLVLTEHGDFPGARQLLRESERLIRVAFWQTLARGALWLAERAGEEDWTLFRKALDEVAQASKQESDALQLKAKEFFLKEARKAVALEKWEQARRCFDLAGVCSPQIAPYLRWLDTRYAAHREKIWGGKPYVTLEDFETQPVLRFWRGGWRDAEVKARRISPPGYRSSRSEEVLIQHQVEDSQWRAYWKSVDVRLFPEDRVRLVAYVRMEGECALPAILMLYVRLKFPEKWIGSPASGPEADEDAGGGWRRVELEDVVGGLTERHVTNREEPLKYVKIFFCGVAVRGHCPAVRVDALEVHLI
ncbi:MAG: hypothetical protein JSV08_00685 [Acidobacteriota bacterium]|nr:MAG: hypothetical protein JSV08_00685 [Acidobacteriota bacterium]